MSNPIIVPQLSVNVVTGSKEKDPYGQGFSAIYGSIHASEHNLVQTLTDANVSKTPVTIRCAMLDITGQVAKVTRKWRGSEFIVVVDDLEYRNPNRPNG